MKLFKFAILTISSVLVYQSAHSSGTQSSHGNSECAISLVSDRNLDFGRSTLGDYSKTIPSFDQVNSANFHVTGCPNDVVQIILHFPSVVLVKNGASGGDPNLEVLADRFEVSSSTLLLDTNGIAEFSIGATLDDLAPWKEVGMYSGISSVSIFSEIGGSSTASFEIQTALIQALRSHPKRDLIFEATPNSCQTPHYVSKLDPFFSGSVEIFGSPHSMVNIHSGGPVTLVNIETGEFVETLNDFEYDHALFLDGSGWGEATFGGYFDRCLSPGSYTGEMPLYLQESSKIFPPLPDSIRTNFVNWPDSVLNVLVKIQEHTL